MQIQKGWAQNWVRINITTRIKSVSPHWMSLCDLTVFGSGRNGPQGQNSGRVDQVLLATLLQI